MAKEINIGIKDCEKNDYPCVMKIDGNSVRVLYEGKDVMPKTSLDESVLNQEFMMGNLEDRLKELGCYWIKNYLNKAVSKLKK